MFWQGSPHVSSAAQCVLLGAPALPPRAGAAFGLAPATERAAEAALGVFVDLPALAAGAARLAGTALAGLAPLPAFAVLADLEALAALAAFVALAGVAFDVRDGLFVLAAMFTRATCLSFKSPGGRRRDVPGRWWDDLEPGLVLHHGTVQVRQEDNVAFCRLTHNTQPLHLDEAYARTTPFGRVVVNGLYTMSLAVGLSVADTTEGTIVANLGYEAVQHPHPVHPGDTLSFATTVRDRRPSSKPGRGVVTLEHRVLNQDGTLVCTFLRNVLVQRRPQ